MYNPLQTLQSQQFEENSTLSYIGDGCIYEIWRKEDKRIRSYFRGRKERGRKRMTRSRGKKDRWEVEIHEGKEVEKCSGSILVDRHALKKITVSSSEFSEERRTHWREQVSKDTPGSQRNYARKFIADSLGNFSFPFMSLRLYFYY